MDRTYIDNHHVLARYLSDQLSEEELRDFEAQLVTNPELVKDLEAAVRLKVGLHKLAKTNELSSLLNTTGANRTPKSRLFALAASVAVIAIGVTFWLSRESFDSPSLVASASALTDRAGKPMAIASRYEILRLRGISYDAEINLPSTPQAIELRVLPEYPAKPARYRVNITRVTETNEAIPMGSVAGLVPAEDEFVALYLDSSKFVAGRYQLMIGGDEDTDAASSVSNFNIKLVAPSVVADPRK
jgi:hypothetical protein